MLPRIKEENVNVSIVINLDVVLYVWKNKLRINVSKKIKLTWSKKHANKLENALNLAYNFTELLNLGTLYVKFCHNATLL